MFMSRLHHELTLVNRTAGNGGVTGLFARFPSKRACRIPGAGTFAPISGGVVPGRMPGPQIAIIISSEKDRSAVAGRRIVRPARWRGARLRGGRARWRSALQRGGATGGRSLPRHYRFGRPLPHHRGGGGRLRAERLHGWLPPAEEVFSSGRG